MPVQKDNREIINERLNYVNDLARGMADHSISCNPFAQVVKIIFNDSEKDVYHDSTTTEQSRVDKRVLVEKNPDLFFVQDVFGDYVEDDDKLPWIVKLTHTGLERMVTHDDQFIINEKLYTVSKVTTGNRASNAFFQVLIYNEHS